jgi:hypothetical protein
MVGGPSESEICMRYIDMKVDQTASSGDLEQGNEAEDADSDVSVGEAEA